MTEHCQKKPDDWWGLALTELTQVWKDFTVFSVTDTKSRRSHIQCWKTVGEKETGMSKVVKATNEEIPEGKRVTVISLPFRPWHPFLCKLGKPFLFEELEFSGLERQTPPMHFTQKLGAQKLYRRRCCRSHPSGGKHRPPHRPPRWPAGSAWQQMFTSGVLPFPKPFEGLPAPSGCLWPSDAADLDSCSIQERNLSPVTLWFPATRAGTPLAVSNPLRQAQAN